MKRAVPFALAAAVAVLAAAACSFPDVSYSTADGGRDAASGGSSGGGGDSAAGTDAPGDSSGPGEGGASDGPANGDAPGDSSTGHGDSAPPDAPLDVAGDGAVDCDQDRDGYKGPQCGGNDCCDTDGNAHPMQTAYFPTPDACGSFDYDCNGTLEPKFSANLTCAGIPTTGCIDNCPTAACTCGGPPCNYGYLGPDPGCGNSASYGTCTGMSLSCVPTQTTANQTQWCR